MSIRRNKYSKENAQEETRRNISRRRPKSRFINKRKRRWKRLGKATKEWKTLLKEAKAHPWLQNLGRKRTYKLRFLKQLSMV